jgi:hypothetical protein
MIIGVIRHIYIVFLLSCGTWITDRVRACILEDLLSFDERTDAILQIE